MATETTTPERMDFTALAKALEEEHDERKAWMETVTAAAVKVSDAVEPLTAMKGVVWPDAIDTEAQRLDHVRTVELQSNQMLARAAAFKSIAGFEPLIRDTDAIFETDNFPTLLAMKDAAELHQQEMIKASLGASLIVPGVDPAWDPLFTAAKEANGGRYSLDSLKNVIKAQNGVRSPGQDSYGNAWQGQEAEPGYGIRSDLIDQHGVKALLSSVVGGAGIQPYAEQLSIIIEKALKRPSVFRMIPGVSMTAKSYTYRQETANTEVVGYFNEAAASRSATTNQGDVTISPATKTLYTAISYMSATYEQLYTEPMARNFFRTRLVGSLERWLDSEIVAGPGGAGKIDSLAVITKDSTSATAAGLFSSGAGGNDNRYKKNGSDESDLQALFRAFVHMEDEDEGNSVPGALILTPVGYENMVNNEIGAADARWLFPSVLGNSAPITPFGLAVIKNKGVTDTTAYIIDPSHLLFRSHAQGVTLEIDKRPKQLEEDLVIHILFQFDCWRNQAVQQITHLFS